MNELLAQAYGTDKLIEESFEKTAESQLLDELVKVANEEGIDLDDFTDEEIVQILSEALEEGDEEGEEDGEEDGDFDQEKLGEADFLGRTMAHAFYNELHSIGEEVEKTAGGDEGIDEETFEAEAVERANEMIAAAAAELEDYEKTAVAEGYDVNMEKVAQILHSEREVGVAQRVFEAISEVEKTSADEEINDALTLRALQLIDESDYDVDSIVDLLVKAEE